MKRFFLLLAIAVFFAQFALAQLFYKIEGKGLSKPSYIFGTHHAAPLSVLDRYNMSDYIDQVDQIVGEVEMSAGMEGMQAQMMKYVMAPEDSTLSKVLTAEEFGRVNEMLKKYYPMDLMMFDKMKPMMVTTLITLGSIQESLPSDDGEEGQLDMYFQTMGREKGKRVRGLESVDFQAQLLYCKLSIREQAEGLLELLESGLDTPGGAAQKLNEAYLSEDLQALKALSDESGEAETDMMASFLDERNANWLEQLPGIMEEGPALIAVGALHLVGDSGILEGLRSKGYTVSPVAGK